MRLWLGQLTLAASNGPVPPPARLVTEDESWVLLAPANAREILTDLLKLWAEGLNRPLPFFPRSAWAFTGQGKVTPEERALTQWNGNRERPGESADPAFDFCFGAVQPHPLDDEFRALAARVCKPLRAAATREKGAV